MCYALMHVSSYECRLTGSSKWWKEINVTALLRRKHVTSNILEEDAKVGTFEIVHVQGGTGNEKQLPTEFRMRKERDTPAMTKV